MRTSGCGKEIKNVLFQLCFYAPIDFEVVYKGQTTDIKKYCPLNIFWRICLKIAKLSQTQYSGCSLRVDVPYWCSGHMVKGHGQNVGLNPKCCVFNIIWIYLWINESNYHLQTIEMQHLKKVSLILQSNQADKTLISILLVEPPIWNFIACMQPFWILHQGAFMFLKHFLFLIMFPR